MTGVGSLTASRPGYGQRSAVRATPDLSRPVPAPAEPRLRASRLPLVLVATSVGTLLISVAFALGRASEPGGDQLYWAGEILYFLPPALFLLASRKITVRESTIIALALPVLAYVIRECYSPDAFHFQDEMQHLITLHSIVTSHHLFASNPSLPISPYFPGLEIVTSGVMMVSGASVYTAGTIVVGICHVVACMALFHLVADMTDSPRVAGLAALVYATTLHYQSFDSYFVYGTMGLPMLLLTLLAFRRFVQRKSWGWGLLAVAFAAGTTVSHHLSAVVMVGFLLAFTVEAHLRGLNPRHAWAALGAAVAILLSWVSFVATGTYGYLFENAARLLAFGTAHKLHAAHETSVAFGPIRLSLKAVGTPLPDQLVTYLAAGLTLSLIMTAIFVFLRNRPFLAFGGYSLWLLSLSVPVIVAVRLVSPGGSQLAGRAFEYHSCPWRWSWVGYSTSSPAGQPPY